MPIAILDLGTNTFNLLIAEKSDYEPFKILHNTILPVKLGKGGIQQNTLMPEAIDRAIDALDKHYHTIQKFGATPVLAYATSAIRTAKNGNEFSEIINKRYGIELLVITGEQEAEYIFYGVMASMKQKPVENILILDIGGGSNEFIIGNQSGIIWKNSYPLGIARLIDQFPPSDPVKDSEIKILYEYFDSKLANLFIHLEKNPVHALVGASGTFDTIMELLLAFFPDKYPEEALMSFNSIPMNDFQWLYKFIIESNTHQRLQMKGLHQARVEMIVYALVFVKYILDKTKLSNLQQSAYSLREGAAFRYFN